MTFTLVNYAVKDRAGNLYATGLTNSTARNVALWEGMARLQAIEDYCDAFGGYDTPEELQQALAQADLFVTPENLS